MEVRKVVQSALRAAVHAIKEGQEEDAIRHANEAVKICKENKKQVDAKMITNALVVAGKANAMAKKLEEAKSAYEEAMHGKGREEEDVRAEQGLAEMYVSLEMFKEALPLLEKVANAASDPVRKREMTRRVATAAMQSSSYEEAIRAWRSVRDNADEKSEEYAEAAMQALMVEAKILEREAVEARKRGEAMLKTDAAMKRASEFVNEGDTLMRVNKEPWFMYARALVVTARALHSTDTHLEADIDAESTGAEEPACITHLDALIEAGAASRRAIGDAPVDDIVASARCLQWLTDTSTMVLCALPMGGLRRDGSWWGRDSCAPAFADRVRRCRALLEEALESLCGRADDGGDTTSIVKEPEAGVNRNNNHNGTQKNTETPDAHDNSNSGAESTYPGSIALARALVAAFAWWETLLSSKCDGGTETGEARARRGLAKRNAESSISRLVSSARASTTMRLDSGRGAPAASDEDDARVPCILSIYAAAMYIEGADSDTSDNGNGSNGDVSAASYIRQCASDCDTMSLTMRYTLIAYEIHRDAGDKEVSNMYRTKLAPLCTSTSWMHVPFLRLDAEHHFESLGDVDSAKKLFAAAAKAGAPWEHRSLFGLARIAFEKRDHILASQILARATHVADDVLDGTNAPPALYLLMRGELQWAHGADGVETEDREVEKGRTRDGCFASWLRVVSLTGAASCVRARALSGLGKWYLHVGADAKRAQKCLMQAVRMDPLLEDAGESLVAILGGGRDGGMHSSSSLEDLCLRAVHEHMRASWAHRSLGRVLLQRARRRLRQQRLSQRSKRGNDQIDAKEDESADSSYAVDAITLATSASEHFQAAIRSKPRNGGLWELLGDAYVIGDRITAAFRAYAQSIALHERASADGDDRDDTARDAANLVHLKLGTLLCNSGHFSEALPHFVNDESGFDAVSGAAKALLGIAMELCETGDFDGASRELSTAFAKIEKAHSMLAEEGSIVVAAECWYTRGSILLMFYDITPDVNVCSALGMSDSSPDHSATSPGNNADRKRRLLALSASSTSFLRAHNLDATNPVFLRCAAVAAHRVEQLRVSEKSASTGSAEAERLAVRALALQPDDAHGWALLGCVSTSSHRQEYAFARALQLNPRLGDVYTAMGDAYARDSRPELAEAAYQQSRIVDADFPETWTGMAQLLTTARDMDTNTVAIQSTVGLREQMEMYRHALLCGGSFEASRGVAAIALSSTYSALATRAADAHVPSQEIVAAAAVARALRPWDRGTEYTHALALERAGREDEASSLASALLADASARCSGKEEKQQLQLLLKRARVKAGKTADDGQDVAVPSFRDLLSSGDALSHEEDAEFLRAAEVLTMWNREGAASVDVNAIVAAGASQSPRMARLLCGVLCDRGDIDAAFEIASNATDSPPPILGMVAMVAAFNAKRMSEDNDASMNDLVSRCINASASTTSFLIERCAALGHAAAGSWECAHKLGMDLADAFT